MSIVVVGSVAYDTIETQHGRADNVLGGSTCYFAVAARLKVWSMNWSGTTRSPGLNSSFMLPAVLTETR